MAEPNATSVGAQPVEVAERSEQGGFPLRQIQISLRVTTTLSANHLCGLLLNTVNRNSNGVIESIRVHRSEKPLAKYDRPRDGR